jgi:hypothetical protein
MRVRTDPIKKRTTPFEPELSFPAALLKFSAMTAAAIPTMPALIPESPLSERNF